MCREFLIEFAAEIWESQGKGTIYYEECIHKVRDEPQGGLPSLLQDTASCGAQIPQSKELKNPASTSSYSIRGTRMVWLTPEGLPLLLLYTCGFNFSL